MKVSCVCSLSSDQHDTQEWGTTDSTNSRGFDTQDLDSSYNKWNMVENLKLRQTAVCSCSKQNFKQDPEISYWQRSPDPPGNRQQKWWNPRRKAWRPRCPWAARQQRPPLAAGGHFTTTTRPSERRWPLALPPPPPAVLRVRCPLWELRSGCRRRPTSCRRRRWAARGAAAPGPPPPSCRGR